MLPCWPGCRPCSTNHWTVLLAVQLQDNHPSAKTSGMQRFRLSTVLCPSARRKPLTCAEINPRWHIRKQGTKFAQPPERQSRAERCRQGADPAAQGGAGAGGCPHAGSHHRGGWHHHVLCRTRPDLIEGASAPFLLRPVSHSGPRGPARAAHLPTAGVCGGARGRSCCSLHRATAFSPSRAARRWRLRPGGRR